VSVKIANTLYVVLYTAPNGANSVEYSVGMDKLFLVGTDTLTFNSALTGTTQVPIIRRKTLSDQDRLDLSKAPGQYFSMKLDHLSEVLGLNDDQRTTIKPALEQEAGEVSQIIKNPVMTRNEKLNRVERIVRTSDAKITPVLSPAQLQKLQQLRRQQKDELRTIVAEQSQDQRH